MGIEPTLMQADHHSPMARVGDHGTLGINSALNQVAATADSCYCWCLVPECTIKINILNYRQNLHILPPTSLIRAIKTRMCITFLGLP